MKKEHFISIGMLLIIWVYLSFKIGNDILVPYPNEVIHAILAILTDSKQIHNILTTIYRCFIGFSISLILGMTIAILAEKFSVIQHLFEPFNSLIKTIPNISYIIVVLIWLGQEASVIVICFLILFPLFYNNFFHELISEDQDLKDVYKIYPAPFSEYLRLRTLRMLYIPIIQTGKTAFSLGFKVCIMAEILGQVHHGIGNQLYIDKINLDTTGIFAWTVIIILISFLVDLLFNRLLIKIK